MLRNSNDNNNTRTAAAVKAFVCTSDHQITNIDTTISPSTLSVDHNRIFNNDKTNKIVVDDDGNDDRNNIIIHKQSTSDNERSNTMNASHAQFQLLPQQPKPSPTHSHHSTASTTTISSSAAAGLKPTHRRGYSHGSYSTLNPQSIRDIMSSSSTSTNHHHSHLPPPTPQSNYLSLGRAHNNLLESSYISDTRNRNFLLNPSEVTTAISGSIMKSSSSEQVDSGAELPSQTAALPSTTLTPNDETKRAIAEIEQKIRKFKKKIAQEQINCNDNVNEYLKLTSSAQPNQSQRLKTVFEKKNQKSSQKIARCQKKMNRLDQELERIKNGGIYHRHPKERLRDVGTNIKEGISGLSGGVIEGIKSGIHTAGETVITKPKEFFKRTTADNAEKNSMEQEPTSTFVTYLIDPEMSQQPTTVTGGVGGNSGMLNSNSHSHSHSTKCTSDDDDDSSSITSESGQLGGMNSHTNSAHYSSSPLRMKPFKRYYTVADIDQLRNRIDERTQDCLRFGEEIDTLKNQFQSECLLFNQTLQDEKYRVERLEEQLNDLTELHQKEIENLKQTISDLEEKIQYQTDERHRDVHEMLESFQTRISRMEHQQHQHLQQLVNLDSLDNSNARALVLKLINVLLTVLQVILLLVATVANILAPFLQTRARIFTSVFVIIMFTFVFQHWPELDMWTRQKLYDNCLYVLDLFPFLSSSSIGVNAYPNRPATT
ncbi:Transmembrane and coiled-coil domains protein [Dermatophagoides farinae]|uniref:Transmembrane and coiled-coil domain family 1-like protein n=1 Tax=Dermatophagoides farinae TaxID=6954 RepID=A0A922IEK1_DERFA|nr:transmembrane and coiled-coil domains protein 1-like [Dermatophagoides farinae]XP_046914007.1 transmembrane and coiled-coil domains protein 1-like [Dermatophagoides farinae]KAH7636655.1 transmembrane and coiled-coil domain family 1-like protein [Dermatophagoides farinae]KAH9527879.1 Transmembrane and coiled-coil domains protein [Dermatophagoides farinae]